MERFACFQLCLAWVVVNITLAGCGGTPLASIDGRIHDADRKFDAAEAFRIKATNDKTREKWTEQVEQRKTLYFHALNAYKEVVNADPGGKYAQRSLWQMSEIYKRRYQWDKIIESYEAILAVSPSGYYADRAKSAIADIRKCGLLIQEEQRKYQDCKGLYAQDNARENYDLAGGALFNVAESYEKLSNYDEAIAYYAQVVDEFPDHEKAPIALTKIGDIHFYKSYDYDAGFPVYYKVIEMYPDTLEAAMALRQLKHTHRDLHDIARCQTHIDEWRTGETIEYAGSPGYHKITEMYPDVVEVIRAIRQLKHTRGDLRDIARNQTDTDKCRNEESPIIWSNFGRPVTCLIPITDEVVRNYQEISRRWVCLRNFPGAILAYRNSILVYQPGGYLDSSVDDRIPYSRYQIGRLFQLNGQLERAIEAYQKLLDKHPDSYYWCVRGVYQQAVCYREIREFTKSYEGFKAYMSLGPDVEYYQEAEQIVRQFEMDRDGDGFKSYMEQDAGTSDQDPNNQPSE